MRFDVGPARFGDALDAIDRALQVARDTVHCELAPPAQLVFVSLHAQQQPSLAARDLIAVFLDIAAATLLDRFNGGSHAILERARAHAADEDQATARSAPETMTVFEMVP